MTPIPVTLFTAGILGILCVVLSVLVSAARARTGVMAGDGAGVPAQQPLFLAVRAQGNFIEYVPLALILLGAIEVSGASRITCEVFAGLLIIARFAHAAGMHRPAPNPLRAGGAMLTWIVLLGLAIDALRLDL